MRFLYVNSENLYPQDTHIIQGLKELGKEVIEITETKDDHSYGRILTRMKKEVRSDDTVIVGYPSPLLAIRARFATSRPIVFNAIASQYEANVISRTKGGAWSLEAIKSWIIDLLSFHLTEKTLLESRAQVEFVSKRYWVSKKKLIVAFSGINEDDFFFDPKIQKRKEFTVLFRGRFLPESGILTVIESAKKLEKENVKFLIIGRGFLYKEVAEIMERLKPTNIEMKGDILSPNELRNLMLSAHVSLGQFAIHPRLQRTLPCKLFESLALKLPYISGRNAPIFEILTEGLTCITANPGDADDLAQKILYLKDNPDERNRIGEKGYELYRESLTSKKLTEDILKNI
jgi:glycosyltransferase involved in cell wall biosynthesis